MKTHTRIFALILSVVMVLALCAGCGGSGDQDGKTPSGNDAVTPPADDEKSPLDGSGLTELGGGEANTEKTDETLTVMLNAEPDNLMGGTMNEGAMIVLNSIGDSVLEFDKANRTYRAGVCTGFEKVDDTHYTFELRDGAVFSDGTPITVEDILYSLNYWKNAGGADAAYFDMENTVKVDDTHFTLALTKYTRGWEFFLAEQQAVVFKRSSFEEIGEEAALRDPPIMAGRYKLTDWTPGSSITVERCDNYYDAEYNGYYKTIKYVFVADAASRVLSVRSGDADVALRISTSDVVSLKNDPTMQVMTVNDGIYCVLFNNTNGPCADPKVREAISYAVDPVAVSNVVMMGLGESANSWVLPYFPYYEDVAPFTYDVEKAKSLLAEAGYGDGLELYLPVIGTHSALATVIQEQLRQAGITVKVEVLEQGQFLETARAGKQDMIVGSTTQAYANDNNFNQINPVNAGRSPQNCWLSGEAAEKVSDLISKCTSSDEATVKAAWSELINYVRDNYIMLPTCTNHLYAAMRADLTGFTVSNRMDYADVTEIHPA